MDTVTLHSALPDAAAGAPPPEWLHLVPAGTVRGVDGRGPYTLAAPATVISASMAGGPIAIDENHAIDHAHKSGIASPARGWIDRMEARADGIWGHVEWTPSGAALMSERAYRGMSPVMQHTQAGSIVRVLRASLTNAPNLAQLTTLHSQQDTDMDIAALRTALGLPDTADEPAVLAKVRENATVASAHSQAMQKIADAAGVAATDEAGLITALQAQRATAVRPDLVTTLQSQLTTLQTERAHEKAVAYVDGAIKAGKPIAPLRDHYVTRHTQDATAVEKEIGALVSINAGGVTKEQIALNAAGNGDGMAELTADDHVVAKKMGLDPKEFAKHKAKMKGAK